MTYRTARSIPDEVIIDIALSIPWVMNSTSDLIAAVRQQLHVSDKIAAKAVRRVLDRSLIKQVHQIKLLPVPPSSMTTGNSRVRTQLTKWERSQCNES